MSHPLKRPKSPSWPSYTGVSSYVGASPSGAVAVYVDPSLGAPGMQNAQALIADGDRVVSANNALFGTKGGAVSVIIYAIDGRTDGTGGADHAACNYRTGNDIEVCASFQNPTRVSALFEAELSECSMGGDLCGVSTGEALSRWCAASVSNNALADFATAPDWAQNGMPDYVDKTDNTDGNAVSTGCGMAFLSWLKHLGYTLDKIAPAMVKLGTGGTLSQLYAALTGGPKTDAWPKFEAAVKALPGVSTDDPFRSGTIAKKGARKAPTRASKAAKPAKKARAAGR